MQIDFIDSMGDDLRVANAARESFQNWKEVFEEKDAGLIRYLADNGHWTPFAHVILCVRVSAPFFVARQWFRHQIGFARNEVSRRYVKTTPGLWGDFTVRSAPDGSIKQGSGGRHPDSIELGEEIEGQMKASLDEYEDLLSRGVAPEQARAVLPLGAYTEWIETASLYAYARLCRQRLDSHAQKEIQDLASQIDTFCAEVAPISWKELMK